MSKLAQSVRLSEAAVTLFRVHVERYGQVEVNDTTRPLYRELASHGLMVAVNTFAGGPESAYRLTKLGFERKGELLSCNGRVPG
jgi:hypothetical protein